MKLRIFLAIIITPLTLRAEPFDEKGPPPHHQKHLERFMTQLQESDPQEFERLNTLKEENPEDFHEALRKKLRQKRSMRKRLEEHPEFHKKGWGKKRNPELQAMEEEAQNLAQAYRATSDQSLKAEQIEKLKEHLSELFDLREQERGEVIEQLESKLTKLKASSNKRTENRTKIIERRLEELTKGEDLKW